LLELTSRAAGAEPRETPKPPLQVVGSCPTADAVERALAPLLKRELSFSSEALARVVDHGNRFAVSVKGQTGQYLDAERDCAERARVSAVFIALTLNPPEIQSSDAHSQAVASLPEGPSPSPPRAAAALAPVETAIPRTHGAWTLLELGARFDGALNVGAPSTLAAGVELRGSLGSGRIGGVLGAAVLAPVIWELSGVLVREQRFPCHLALRLRWASAPPELSLDLGVSATTFVVRAPELGGESLATRLDLGPRAALTTQFEPVGGVSPYLGAQLEYFPRSYRLYADPAGQVGSTPHVWVGMNLGVSLAPN
jgi:hypothetical protein